MTSITSASRWSRARVVVLLVGLVLALLQAPARAQQVDPLREAQVKAGYLINFLRYTSFPERPDEAENGPWRIMVLGDESLREALEVAARSELQVQERDIRVVPVQTGAGALPAVDLVYIADEVSRRDQQLVRALSGAPILTVGESEAFIEQGGMLRLRLEGGRIVFDANLDALRGASLSMSAKALTLARRLHPEPAP